jgi:hypothetical protein
MTTVDPLMSAQVIDFIGAEHVSLIMSPAIQSVARL